jgi:hypothetical protein
MLYAIINNIVPITIAAATIATAAITTSAITTAAITILRPVIEVDYDDANEEAWNQLDYQEWLCD